MPEQLPPPRNIFEAMNQNIYNLGRNQQMTMDMIAAMRNEVAELRAMFQAPAPEQPNARGEEGAEAVSSEQ